MAFELLTDENNWEIALFDFKIDTDVKLKDLVDFRPKRATSRSAGYDFCIPFDLNCEAGKSYVVPTGYKWNPYNCYSYLNTMKVVNPTCVVLLLYPRSSLAFKYGFKLDNTVGVIDADYYNNPANEGHILVKFSVEKDLSFKQGEKFCQGIITPFFFDSLDPGDVSVTAARISGIGSTDSYETKQRRALD